MTNKFLNPSVIVGLLLVIILLCIVFVWMKSAPRIDEKYAAALVKKELSISGPITAQQLKGGLTNAQVFVVSTESKKYVLKMFHTNQEDIHKEIQAALIASEEGYGPHIYFSDIKSGILIMDFLSQEKFLPEEHQTDNTPVALAHLLEKIHRGPDFDTFKNIFKDLIKRVDQIEAAGHTNLPLAKIKNRINEIRQAVRPYATTAPCHNDLNPYNIIFRGNEFKAIDFESAEQADPYFDVATIANFYCLTPTCEQKLFKAYLEHTPSPNELMRLTLMKQLSFINFALGFLALSSQQANLGNQYNNLQAPDYADILKDFYHGNIDIENHEHRLKFAKAMINEAFATKGI
jgi:thiamine kinase-like enzyme